MSVCPLLLAAAICSFTILTALPMEGFTTNSCQCHRTTSSIIPPRQYQRIEIVPPGAHCRKTEIMILKKDNSTVCVDPAAPWINKVVTKVMKSKQSKQ